MVRMSVTVKKNPTRVTICCRKGEPKSGLLSNTEKGIVQGDTRANKARDFIGKKHLGEEQYGRGIQENCSATCSQSRVLW